MSYRIKRVAGLTGIRPDTLRAWERRYGVVTPHRTEKGYRVYTEADVATLSRVKLLVEGGLTIGEAVARERRVAEPLPRDATPATVGELRADLREALLALDRPAALAAYGRAAHLSAGRRVDELLLPLLREVGELWAHGHAGAGDEHHASAFVRDRLAALLAAVETGAAGAPEAVFAGPPGEHHELGLLGAAVHLATLGWRITYLGPDVPLAETTRILAARRPPLFCTSVVMVRPAAELKAVLGEMRAAAPRTTSMLVGGRGVPAEPPAIPHLRVARDMRGLPRPDA